MTNIISFDPGINGAFAVLSTHGALIDCGDLPLIGTGKSATLNVPEIASIVREWNVNESVIERVSAMPGQGVSSMFRFGEAYGTLQGVLGALVIPITRVRPVDWKRHHKITGKGSDGAEQARQKVIDRFTKHHSLFARKKDHGRADACLIGLYYLSTRLEMAA